MDANKRQNQTSIHSTSQVSCHLWPHPNISLFIFTDLNALLQYYMDDRNNRERSGQDDELCTPFIISSCKPATDF